MAIYCPNCGIELPDGVSFCDACGTPIRSAAGAATVREQGLAAQIGSTSCPVCGAAALPGEAFCDNCGAPLLSAEEYAEPVGLPGAPPPALAPAASAPAGAQPAVGPSSAASRHASIVVVSPPPPATLPLPNRAEMIVGRSDPQSNSYPDVDLGPYGGLDLGVSRRHFRLTRTGDQYYIEDLDSMNGSVVNSHKLPPYSLQPLRSGDRISLGKMELRFDLS